MMHTGNIKFARDLRKFETDNLSAGDILLAQTPWMIFDHQTHAMFRFKDGWAVSGLVDDAAIFIESQIYLDHYWERMGPRYEVNRHMVQQTDTVVNHSPDPDNHRFDAGAETGRDGVQDYANARYELLYGLHEGVVFIDPPDSPLDPFIIVPNSITSIDVAAGFRKVVRIYRKAFIDVISVLTWDLDYTETAGNELRMLLSYSEGPTYKYNTGGGVWELHSDYATGNLLSEVTNADLVKFMNAHGCIIDLHMCWISDGIESPIFTANAGDTYTYVGQEGMYSWDIGYVTANSTTQTTLPDYPVGQNRVRMLLVPK